MAPALVQAAPGSTARHVEKESSVARLLGSGASDGAGHSLFQHTDAVVGSAGIAELAIFHPVRLHP